MDKKVNVSYLKKGMFVSKLDRPWIETPFLLEGFLIETDEDIAGLLKYCTYVYIDPNKGLDNSDIDREKPKLKTNSNLERFLQDNKKQVQYKNTTTVKAEISNTQDAIESASDQFADIMEGAKDGKPLNIASVRGIVEPILDSIIRNPEAYMWLSMMHEKSAYVYSHSVDNCALAIVFGRFMGLPKKDLRTLANGLLMMDLGNMRIPEQILNKNGKFTDAEYRIVKRHVNHSVDILKSTEGIDEDIINIALTHHERFDGSGYPNALYGVQIPVYGRIAAIIDSYSAMTSSRSFSSPLSAYTALQKIYNERGSAFQPELVEQFLQCMGAYPTGSLVEMSSGEVGIVLEKNETQRMRPKIMLILKNDKSHYEEYKIIDLAEHYEDALGEPLNIVRGIDPGTYGIDPAEYYL